MTSSTEPLPSAAQLASATGKPLHLATAWLKRLSEVEAHVAEHGRFPRARYGGKSEAHLYDWGRYQKETSATGLARQILDTRLPGWDERRAPVTKPFEEWVQKLKVHRDAYGTWPSLRSQDAKVRGLSSWLAYQRIVSRAGKLAPARKALLDNQVPGWNETPEETWERTAEEIAVFRSRNGCMPSGASKEHRERRLSRWLDDMRRGRGMSPERRAFLHEALPGWDVTRFSRSSKAAASTRPVRRLAA